MTADQEPASRPELLRSLGEFFKRQLISLPMMKRHLHQSLQQRCGLRSATLELDMTAHPNIEYIAGNRLSVYPANPADQVQHIMTRIVDDLSGAQNRRRRRISSSAGTASLSDFLDRFAQVHGRDALKLALTYLYDIMMAPSRELLRLLAERCANKEQKARLMALSAREEAWEKWLSGGLRTLKSTLDEFSACSGLTARQLLAELSPQQPRQYSISSIKSSKRFRVELVVIQHKFSNLNIANHLNVMKENEQLHLREQQQQALSQPSHVLKQLKANEVSVSNRSTRSLRSVAPFSATPISSQQVRHVPNFSGPLMSQYAGTNSALNSRLGSKSKSGSHRSQASKLDGSQATDSCPYEGLCSNYLLNLSLNEHIVCEFVENPRFTLKGNRERPIMMIAQDVGIVSFRPFWQQRAMEHDRAQVFYTLFKDLKPKKFGDMQLVCLTGSKCRIEDLFRREIQAVCTSKILSTAIYLNRAHLTGLLDKASNMEQQGQAQAQMKGAKNVAASLSSQLDVTESREMAELGQRIANLLVEFNGCLYTCCDAQMTQAIEILAVESIAKHNNIPKDEIMALLPKWKGRNYNGQPLLNNKFLFTLENPFERAQIVEEIYDVPL